MRPGLRTTDSWFYWKDGSDLAKLAGLAIRLRIVLRDADLFAFRFAE